MDRLATLAKRIPAVTGELEVLVRGIGESKSKSEEDAIVQRMIEISKQQIQDGIPRKSENTKPLKDLLVYLVYINMLGHETSWASAAVIQLCSHRSLSVKKAAYLATSLLIDPSSELTIMVTATIQADLKSDNFLVVCTALQAVSRCAGSELVSVYLPQVVSLLRHDRDQVKKKALLALHRLLQLDPSIAPDVERHLIDKLGHKEPSVMFAALAGLHELVKVDPAPYKNLVHYFTNILKQASEGKLGRSWDYHRFPAPFVQIELLRLLAFLAADDAAATSNMSAVLLDIWRRAETLPSTAVNAVVYECMRTATAVYPSDALLSQVLNTVPRFLSAKENNLRYAGIDILTRIVAGDAGRVEQFQLVIVDCLRSPDVSLKRKTLDLLFKMASSGNIDVIAREVLAYVKDGGDDAASRSAASAQLLAAAESLAPSLQWFADTVTVLLEESGDVAPPAAAHALIRVLADGSGGEDASGDEKLRASVALHCFELLEKPKLPEALLRVVCWTLGSYGMCTGKSFESVVERVAAIPETQATSVCVLSAVAMALGKLAAARSGQSLPGEAVSVLETLSKSQYTEVQQMAAEVLALTRAEPATQRAAFPSNDGTVAVDAALPFLDAYVQQAAENGAPPYLSLQDRVAMGVTRAPDTLFPPALLHQSSLKFKAYEESQPPQAQQATAVAPPAAAEGDFFDGLDLGGVSIYSSEQPQISGATPTAGAALPAESVPVEQQRLRVEEKRGGRKWGPTAATRTSQAIASSPDIIQQVPSSSRYQSHGKERPQTLAAAAAVNPEQQRLAASLFGGGGVSIAGGRGIGTRGGTAPATSKAPDFNLLGDLHDAAPTAATASGVDLLGDDFAGGGEEEHIAALSGITVPFEGTETATTGCAGGAVSAGTQQQHTRPGPSPAQSRDPFAGLLD